jgi:hypothetical protein
MIICIDCAPSIKRCMNLFMHDLLTMYDLLTTEIVTFNRHCVERGNDN